MTTPHHQTATDAGLGGKAKQTAHTPGPWITTLSGPGPTCRVEGGGLLIARVMASHDCALGQPPPETAQANAHLIASAPALQARNEELVRLVDLLLQFSRELTTCTNETFERAPLIKEARAALSGQPSPQEQQREEEDES